MFHLAAYNQSYNSAVENDLTPVQDDVLLIQNGHFVSQYDRYLLWAAAMGVTLSRARVITPALRQITTPFIRPIELLATPGSLPGLADYRRNPILLKGLEEIQINTVQGSGGAEREIVLVGLTRTFAPQLPQGTIYAMRGTSVMASVANAWTSLAVTWQDTLPAGSYACVGLEAVGATEVAARMIFEDQIDRPGCLGGALVGNKPAHQFIDGAFGVWGQFTMNRMPTIQVLNTAVVSVHELYLYFIRLN